MTEYIDHLSAKTFAGLAKKWPSLIMEGQKNTWECAFHRYIRSQKEYHFNKMAFVTVGLENRLIYICDSVHKNLVINIFNIT